jgi:hypothetical protein
MWIDCDRLTVDDKGRRKGKERGERRRGKEYYIIVHDHTETNAREKGYSRMNPNRPQLVIF